MRDGDSTDSHIKTNHGRAASPKEPVHGPVPMHHRLKLGQTDGVTNPQGAGNPSTVPTATAGGRKTW
jgi:hypothetical protein